MRISDWSSDVCSSDLPRYSVVVANPPYMGSGNMGAALAAWLRVNYPNTRYDLMTAFMERAHLMCVRGGLYGMINLPSWMFLSSYYSMRAGLLAGSVISDRKSTRLNSSQQCTSR